MIAIISAVASTVAALISFKNGKKADAIHILVNSNLTTVKDDLAAARLEILHLQDMLKREP